MGHDAQGVELTDDIVELRLGSAARNAVGGRDRRDPDTGALGSDLLDHRGRTLQHQPSTKQLLAKVLVLARIADGATGAAPFSCRSTCETRPTCRSRMKNRPPLRVHGGRDLAPAVDLSLGVDAGRILVTLSLPRDLRGLGNQQTGRRALAVILRGEIAWNEARASAIARQGSHDDTIRWVSEPRV